MDNELIIEVRVNEYRSRKRNPNVPLPAQEIVLMRPSAETPERPSCTSMHAKWMVDRTTHRKHKPSACALFAHARIPSCIRPWAFPPLMVAQQHALRRFSRLRKMRRRGRTSCLLIWAASMSIGTKRANATSPHAAKFMQTAPASLNILRVAPRLTS